MRIRRSWSRSLVRTKMTLMLLAAMLGAATCVWVGEMFGLTAWTTCLGLPVLLLLLGKVGRSSISNPIEQMVQQLNKIVPDERPPALRDLPTRRDDEVGAIARGVQRLSLWCMRDYHDARQLRRTLDQRIARATQNATQRLQRMTMRDPLTDLGNRRFLDEHLDELVQSVEQSNEDLVCIAMDLDNFKKVNDTLGHSAGDDLLVFVSSVIRGCTRYDDYAVRLGGDEFVILAPACDIHRGEELAQQVVSLFGQHARTTLPANCMASMSAGVAAVKADDVCTGEELMRIADERLYKAKQAGKNAVVAA